MSDNPTTMSEKQTVSIDSVREVVCAEIAVLADALGVSCPILAETLCPMDHIPGLTSDLAEALTADILLRLEGPETIRCPFTARRNGRLQNLGECIEELYIALKAA